MKINKPSKVFLGHIYIEYTGNNLALINSSDSSLFQDVLLLDYISINGGEHIHSCFKVDLLDTNYLIDFSRMSVYTYDRATKIYTHDDCSHVTEYRTFSNRNAFIVSGKLQLLKFINEDDSRNETFNINLFFDKKQVIINLFK